MADLVDEDWKKSLAWHWNKIQENQGIALFDSEKQKIRTLGVLIEVPQTARAKINEWLTANLSREYDEYIIRQPISGYHVSLQWTEQENILPEKQEEVLGDIKTELLKLSKITTNITLVYPSFVNLFAPCLMDNSVLESARDGLREVFQKHNLRIGIPKEVYGAWVSLARFKKQLPQELIEKLQSLPKDIIPNVVLDTVLLTINDPMFTPENSQVLDKIILKK